MILFPHTFDDLIPIGHPLRLANEVLDKISITTLLDAYRKEGIHSYHLLMILKMMFLHIWKIFILPVNRKGDAVKYFVHVFEI